MTPAEATEAVRRYGSIRRAAMELGVPRTTFSRLLRRYEMDCHEAARQQTVEPKGDAKQLTVGRTLDEFRAAYDRDTIITTRIRTALERLGDGWEYEAQFARLAGVSLADLGAYREMYADHVVYIRKDQKRAWTGCTRTAELMREMVA